MKKLIAKIKRMRITRWSKLTRGEKVLRVIWSLVKIAAIIAAVVALAGVIVAVVLGVAIAFGMAGAIAGGFDDASRGYGSRDIYVHFR